MASFGAFASKVMDIGGFSFGLSSYRAALGNSKTAEDLANISKSETRYMLRKTVWEVCRGDEIRNQSIADLVLDWYLADGRIAIRRIQRMFGIKVSGDVKRQLLSYLNGDDGEWVFRKIMTARINYVRKTDGEGLWIKRLSHFSYQP